MERVKESLMKRVKKSLVKRVKKSPIEKIEPKSQKRFITNRSRHVFTWTVTNFKDTVKLLLADKGQDTNCTYIWLGKEKDLFGIEMDVTSPHTLTVMYRVFMKNNVLHVKLTSSILNSDNEIERSYKPIAIPKDMDQVLFHHDIRMSTLLNEENRLISNDTMTIVGEIVFLYKSSFQECAGITTEYVDYQRASIVFFASHDQQSPFQNKEKGDVIVSCKGAEFEAQKAILSSRSAVFSSMFDLEGPRLVIKDVNKIILQELLDFLHGEDILDKSIDFIVEMFSAVSKYAILDLKRLCSSILAINLNLDNVCKVAVLANENNDDKLFAAAQEFAKKNLLELMISKMWIDFVQNSIEVAKRFVELGEIRF